MTTQNVRVKVSVPSTSFDDDIDFIIKDKALSQLKSKEIENVGLITSVEKIINISGGDICLNGSAKFEVVVQVLIYKPPKVGSIIKSTVSEVSLHGFRLFEPIEIFVNTDSKPTVKVDDQVSIKINKVTFKNGKFLILGSHSK